MYPYLPSGYFPDTYYPGQYWGLTSGVSTCRPRATGRGQLVAVCVRGQYIAIYAQARASGDSSFTHAASVEANAYLQSRDGLSASHSKGVLLDVGQSGRAGARLVDSKGLPLSIRSNYRGGLVYNTVKGGIGAPRLSGARVSLYGVDPVHAGSSNPRLNARSGFILTPGSTSRNPSAFISGRGFSRALGRKAITLKVNFKGRYNGVLASEGVILVPHGNLQARALILGLEADAQVVETGAEYYLISKEVPVSERKLEAEAFIVDVDADVLSVRLAADLFVLDAGAGMARVRHEGTVTVNAEHAHQARTLQAMAEDGGVHAG